MILVNDPADRSVTYSQLLHSAWHGFTFADTIFPAFLWIAGFASLLSSQSRAGRGASRASLLAHAAWRALLLFTCGLLLELFPYFELSHYQLTGVLQKIAVSYFIAYSIGLFTDWRGQLLAVLGVFVGYIAFMLLAVAPDCAADAWSAACNGARRLDEILPAGHLWQSAAGNDPDGIVGTLAGTGSVLLGMLCARAFAGAGTAGLRRLLMCAAAAAAAGLALATWIPINKILWTPSYALFMAGLSAAVFAGVYWLVDLRGQARATFILEVFGRNALAAYILSRLLVDLLKKHYAGHSIYHDLLLAVAPPPMASLLFACLNVAVVYCIVWVMYRRQIFVKL